MSLEKYERIIISHHYKIVLYIVDNKKSSLNTSLYSKHVNSATMLELSQSFHISFIFIDIFHMASVAEAGKI